MRIRFYYTAYVAYWLDPAEASIATFRQQLGVKRPVPLRPRTSAAAAASNPHPTWPSVALQESGSFLGYSGCTSKVGETLVELAVGPYKTGFNDRMWDTSSRWMNSKTNFTRMSDMAGTAAILDHQYDPQEAIDALADLVQAEAPRFRNVVPLAIEKAIKERQLDAWVRGA